MFKSHPDLDRQIISRKKSCAYLTFKKNQRNIHEKFLLFFFFAKMVLYSDRNNILWAPLSYPSKWFKESSGLQAKFKR